MSTSSKRATLTCASCWAARAPIWLEMTRIGLPVPQGFTISTEACTRYYDDGEKIGEDIEKQIYEALATTEQVVGKKFGDENDPWLVSVRSGARASMPGMMDTILNLGLNDVVW